MSVEVQNFQEDVIDASSSIPVLVDFWAEWCGPCRILGPVLEKLEAEQTGQWKLAKLDTEAHPELSAQFRIQSIPAVKLFVDGQVVNEFTGALPEHAVREWLDNAIPSESKAHLAHALELLQNDQRNEALLILESLAATDASNPEVIGPLARLLFFQDLDRSKSLAVALADDPKFKPVHDAIVLLGDIQSRRATLESLESTTDGLENYTSAIDSLEAGDIEQVLISLIEVLKVNRYLDDDGSRKMGIALFIILGDAHPLTKKYRRTFDMWLY